jgi:hypothetical protein
MSFSTIALAALLVWGLAIAGLSVGLIFQRKALSGSCGGVDADGKPLADCLCEKAREAANRAGAPALTESDCEYEV